MQLEKVNAIALEVRTAHQGGGIGGKLLAHFANQTSGPLLVGKWASAEWAIRFYERRGFRLVSLAEKNRLLSTYWGIPSRQKETSVVLEYTR
jgi:GNAT superfamily N-acetyltransferase